MPAPTPANGFFYRTARLVESVQFVDGLIDPNGTSDFIDEKLANAFLDKLGHKRNWRAYELVVELRAVSRLFSKQDLTVPLRAKVSGRRRSQASLR